MAEFMKFTNGVLHWNVSFFRAVHDWELEALSNFMIPFMALSKGDWGG